MNFPFYNRLLSEINFLKEYTGSLTVYLIESIKKTRKLNVFGSFSRSRADWYPASHVAGWQAIVKAYFNLPKHSQNIGE